MKNTETICPHCGGITIDYKLPFWKNWSWMAVKIYRSRHDQFHPRELDLKFSQRANLHKLRYWGLIEPGDAPGFWRMTDKGRAFVEGRVKIPSFVITRRNQVIDVSPDEHYIQEIIGKIPSKEFFQDQAAEQIRDATQRNLF